jgi:nitrogenase molybdenum-iron protein alpha/beta subunit
VITTPVVAINNDDIVSVAEELREELGIHILPVYTDGFKSKTGVTGYDAVLHALLKYLPLAPGEQEPFINVLSITETPQDLGEIKHLIHALGLEANILPHTAALDNFLKAPQAKASISINPDYCEYLGKTLEENFQVKFLQPAPPIGLENTYQWLAALGRETGLEQAADALHRRESEQIASLIPPDALTNIKLYINLPPALAWGVSDLVEEWGAEVVGLTVHHIDCLHQARLAAAADKKPNLPIHVAHGQHFELANILRRLTPDVYIGSAEDVVWAAKSGIPSIAIDNLPILGYRGMVAISRQFRKILANQSFVQSLKQNTALPYQESWYAKSPNWHIKVEVK